MNIGLHNFAVIPVISGSSSDKLNFFMTDAIFNSDGNVHRQGGTSGRRSIAHKKEASRRSLASDVDLWPIFTMRISRK
jgi:hypothetical protein